MTAMRDWPVVLRMACSVTLSAIVSIVLFVAVSLAPLLLAYAVHGISYVYDAPAHGGPALLLSIPIGAIASLGTFVVLAFRLYRVISR